MEVSLPPHIRYSCRYWVDHLVQSDIDVKDYGLVHKFLQNSFLHWFEALSLLGMVSDGILAIQKLEVVLLKTTAENQTLKDMVYDARRFMLTNRSMVERFPLQIYCAGLVFAPSESIVRKHFTSSIPRWITAAPQVNYQWDPLLQTLEGHSELVTSLAFSPDGRFLASASYDYTIRLWDVATGSSHRILEGHVKLITTLAFSPDGKLLASGSWDKTIRLWDTVKNALQGILRGHSHWVTTLAFSRDGKHVTSVSADKTIRIWHVTAKSCFQTIIYPHFLHVVALSPDLTLIANVSHLHVVTLWNVDTQSFHRSLEGHSSTISCVTFSPDEKLVASSSRDQTIRLWDVATGDLCGTIEAYADGADSLLFSPDGKLIAAGLGSTIQIWDTATRVRHGILEDNGGALAFSPDGKLLAVESENGNVNLWDVSTKSLHQTCKDYSHTSRILKISPDGKHIASKSPHKTIQLWDAETGSLRRTLEGFSDIVTDVAFSPDGKLLASISWVYDHTIRLWDVTTGVLLKVLEGHSERLVSLVFSPDGKFLTSGSYKTIRLWDGKTGEMIGTFDGHPCWLDSLEFSPNSKLLASGSNDGSLWVWNVATRSSKETYKVQDYSMWSQPAFSPNGRILIYGSFNLNIKLWDLKSGSFSTIDIYNAAIEDLRGINEYRMDEDDMGEVGMEDEDIGEAGMDNDDMEAGIDEDDEDEDEDDEDEFEDDEDEFEVRKLAFSPDGKLFACGTSSNRVFVWDVTTRAIRGTLEGYSRCIYTLTFSPDGMLCVNGTKFTNNQWANDLESLPEERSEVVKYAPELWNLSDEWILYGQRKLIFLPPAYRTYAIYVNDVRVGWGIQSGKVFRLELKNISAALLDPANKENFLYPLPTEFSDTSQRRLGKTTPISRPGIFGTVGAKSGAKSTAPRGQHKASTPIAPATPAGPAAPAAALTLSASNILTIPIRYTSETLSSPIPSTSTPTPQEPTPVWLTQALTTLNKRYPNDRFEGTMRWTAMHPQTEQVVLQANINEYNKETMRWKWTPRIRCSDCPGKWYTPGPGEGVENFMIHLKNRGHRARVEGRLAKEKAEREGGGERVSEGAMKGKRS